MPPSAPGLARFQRASDQSLLIYFGNEITREAHEHIRRFLRLLELEPIAGVRNLHPAYCSVLIKFDALELQHDALEKILKKYLGRLEGIALPPKAVEVLLELFSVGLISYSLVSVYGLMSRFAW